MEQPANNNIIFENDNKSEPPSQLRTGSVTALDLASSSPTDNFNPGWRFYASFISLCIITLAVALDATSLSVALPVIAPLLKPSMVPDRCDTSETHGLVWRGIQTKLTLRTRSLRNPSTAAPSTPFGAGHPSS